MTDPSATHQRSAVEIQAEVRAEHEGEPFVLYRDAEGAQRIVPLGGAQPLTIGRDESTDIVLSWDASVSRVHAQLERLGADWAVGDDGLSRNGSFLNGRRITGRRRLRDGDRVQVGGVVLVFRDPGQGAREETELGAEPVDPTTLTETQRKVLIELCRPFKGGGRYASPPTNQVIAEQLFLSVDAIKAHLRVLYMKYGIEDLPHNQKRLKLVELAMNGGAVTERDL
jgi:pSer/pThr/pTyr-binding forkhead associated (FHA) protein